MRPISLDELLEQLRAVRDRLGGNALVVVGERGVELVCSVEVESWPDIENGKPIH